MKISTKIYYILTGELILNKGGKNKQYIQGYKDALLHAMMVETQLKKGTIDYIDPYTDETVVKRTAEQKYMLSKITGQ